MTPTPEIHLVDKPFIAQEFSFSKFWGNPRRKCAEQIKSDAAAARKKANMASAAIFTGLSDDSATV
jgi:hypothetical protein